MRRTSPIVYHHAQYSIRAIVLFFLASLSTAWVQAQNFEYVLSQKELVGSKINDIAVVGDRIILVGGGTMYCHTPAFWVFDTSGLFLSYETLPINYEYGEVTQIAFDSSQAIFHLLGFSAPAFDVGGPSNFAWQLDQNLVVLNEHDFIDTSWHDLGQFADESFSISFTDRKKLHLYGADYQRINTIDIPQYLYQRTSGRKIDSTFLLYVEDASQNSVQLLDWNGVLQDSATLSPFDKLITIGSSFYTIGTDAMLRKYDGSNLSSEKSISLDNGSSYNLRVLTSDLIEVISYHDDEPTATYLFDRDLNEIHHFKHLASERQLKGFLYEGSYYHAGYDANDELSYTKKTAIADRDFNRPHISIINAIITREVTPTSTTITPEDTLYNFYGTEEALLYELTFENTSDSIISSFTFHSDVVYSFNCLKDDVYRFVDGVQLAPGETITISDSTYLYNQIGKSDGFSFYVGAPNHWLTGENLSSYSVDVTTGIFHRKAQPTSFQVFPNPVQNTLTISHEGIPHHADYHVFATDGKRLASGKLFDKDIPVWGLSPGFYRLQIISKEEVYTSSFVKE